MTTSISESEVRTFHTHCAKRDSLRETYVVGKDG